MICGSDLFRGIPGICAACFALQRRVPHPPWYFCPHSGNFAVRRGFAWKVAQAQRLDADDLARIFRAKPGG